MRLSRIRVQTPLRNPPQNEINIRIKMHGAIELGAVLLTFEWMIFAIIMAISQDYYDNAQCFDESLIELICFLGGNILTLALNTLLVAALASIYLWYYPIFDLSEDN